MDLHSLKKMFPLFMLLLFVKLLGKGNGKTNILHTHSFKSPITGDDLNNGWNINFSSTSTYEYLVLIPNVYNKRGLLFHDKPILSSNIQIEFNFHMYKEIRKEVINEKHYKPNEIKLVQYKTNTPEKKKVNGFALWLLEKEFTSTKLNEKNNTFEEKEFIFYGYKKNFNGIGIFFQLLNEELIVSGLSNNGNVKVNLNNAISKTHNFNSLIFNNLVTVRINTGAKGISVEFYDYHRSIYIQSLIINKKVPKKNYIGFSAFNFDEDTNYAENDKNKYIPTFVGIKQLAIYDKDNIEGDDTYNLMDNKENIKIEKPLISDDLDASVENLLNKVTNETNDDSSSDENGAQEIQTEALREIIKLLKNMLVKQTNREEKLLQHIYVLQQKLNSMQIELRDFKKYYQNKNEEPLKFEKIFTTELSGLKNLFQNHTQRHKKNIEDISNRLTEKLNQNPELKILAQKAEKLETIISSKNSTTYVFYVAFTSLILTTFFLIYKKIKDVEKKHIL